ncbi:hypothetical protein [Sphaerotilus sulfidivorans]
MIASQPCSCYLLACLTWHFWRLCGHYPFLQRGDVMTLDGGVLGQQRQRVI